MNNKINHLAVWILVVVYFLIGWGWYTILGEKWLNLHARTLTDIENTHNVGAYLISFVASILATYMLTGLIGRTNPATVWVSLQGAVGGGNGDVVMDYIF